ncbi:MAG: Uma2 family endonuclease [Hyphomicrobiaceae bacterium]|nr:Uma2 family endonuclease [Hyphomicrobiaceae bacterium]
MNTFARMDPESFFLFAARHPEQRYELENGVIMQQTTGGTKRHGLLARRISMAIEAQIDLSRYCVLQDRGVLAHRSGRFPDVVVEPIDEPADSLRTTRPVLIAEVLSPSAAATDLNAKQGEYLGIATLDAYIVASQDEPAMQIWQRGADGTFPAEPVEVAGSDRTVRLDGRQIAFSLDLAALYRGLVG